MQTFGFQSNGVAKMGFAQTCPAIDDQGVESTLARVFGHFEAGRTCQSVAIAFNKALESVVFVELRVDLKFFQSRDDEVIDGALR